MSKLRFQKGHCLDPNYPAIKSLNSFPPQMRDLFHDPLLIRIMFYFFSSLTACF